MTSIKTLAAVSAGAFVLAAGGVAQAQTPYGSYPQQPQQSQPSGQDRVVEAIFGALFGNNQTLDSEWSRGRRPLFNQRTAFEARLDAGVRDRTLSYDQSSRLRADFNDLVALETRYAADGRITTNERSDLTSRYQQLTSRLDGGYDDGAYDNRQWRPLVESRTSFFSRLDTGVRNRTLTRAQSTRLSTDFNALLQLETNYGRNGIDAREQQDLEARWADLNRRVGDDYDDGYGNDGDGYGGGYDSNGRHIADIEAAIVANERSGAVNRTEAERLRTELSDLTRLEAAYMTNGLNTDERSYLTRRFGELDARVRYTRR